MMLQGLFKIGTLSPVDEFSFSAQVDINVSHPVFGGHFPERPILPGVCSIHLIKEV
jgi:3-hydroxyacyl-[acyl-carrier-protein] dehydratase